MLLVIISFGVFLRFYQLGEIPNGFYVDEAAIGYNAYSLLKTGRDEFGKFMPVFLRSYEAYAPILYTYLTIPFVRFLGLNIFSVRALSALSGSLSIVFVYLIVKKLNFSKWNFLSLLTALIFATSPWAIFFSRGGYEANLAFLLLLVSCYLILLAKEKLLFLPFSCLFLGLSTYAYQAERAVAYLLLFGSTMIFLKKDFKKKVIIVSVLLFFLIQLPQFFLLNTPAFKQRASGLFYKETILAQAAKIKLPKFLGIPLAFTREFSANFVSYLSPRNLFYEGDADLQRGLPGISVFYSWMVVPYLVGFFLVLKKYKEKNTRFLLIFMVSILLVVSLTKDPFSTLRSLPLSFPLSLIISLGIEKIILNKYRVIIVTSLTVLLLISCVFFWRSYFVLFPYERARIWGYGYRALADEIQRNPDKIFIIDQARTKPSYIQLAFFLKVPPEYLQKAVDPDIAKNYYTNINFSNDYRFANIQTRGIDWKNDPCQNLILVGDEFTVSSGQAKEHFLTEVFEIKDPVGMIVFRGFKTNPAQKCP